MNIKIEGDPGTGNTFMEIHIQHVEHFHTTVPVVKDGMRSTPQDAASQTITP